MLRNIDKCVYLFVCERGHCQGLSLSAAGKVNDFHTYTSIVYSCMFRYNTRRM